MTGATAHRLTGLEPDNLLAFLALLGLLRALETVRPEWHPRAYWDVEHAPLRPSLRLARHVSVHEITANTAKGVDTLTQLHSFDGQKDLNYSRSQCRKLLKEAAKSGQLEKRGHADLLAALMSDAATKDDKKEPVDPTPLCLLFGQGHQHFLERLESVPHDPIPPRRGRGKQAIEISAADCLEEALFQSWHRSDPTFSFRWDPEEDVRYALMAGNPTDAAYKPGTQHGANRLAAVALSVLTVTPEMRAERVRPRIVGGRFDRNGFSFAWPIWREPATLAAIRALLAHPALRGTGSLAHLSVDYIMVTRRTSVGKYMNFTRARPYPDVA